MQQYWEKKNQKKKRKEKGNYIFDGYSVDFIYIYRNQLNNWKWYCVMYEGKLQRCCRVN